MTRRISVFDSPFLLGFDQFERALDRAARNSNEGYPPYNIEQLDDVRLRITVAVAGFTLADLSVTLEQNQLMIRGKRDREDDESRVFLHKGIAMRQFQRAFVLSDDIVIEGASLDNGLLSVDLMRLIPETTVQTIEIKAPAKNKGTGKEPQKLPQKLTHTIDVQQD